MKIAHLASVHHPFDVRIFHKECQTLTQAGYDVVLIVPHTHDETVEGVRICAVPEPRNRLRRMLCTAPRIVWLGLKEKAKIYHFHDAELLPWVQFLRLRRCGIVYDMHENVPKAILSKHWIPPMLREMIAGAFKLAERVLLAGMYVVFAELSYQKDYPWVSRSAVILNMPRIEALADVRESKYTVPTVAYIGRVAAIRGSLLTLRALHVLWQRGRRVNWECIGPIEGSHERELQLLVNTLGLEGVTLRGYMLPSEGWRVVSRCHVGLAVLEPIPNYFESYPTKLFEYMALGLPLITSDFPLYREIVEGSGCGLCVPFGDPQALASGIEWLIEHPCEAEAMGRRGREAVYARFNWDAEAQKLLSLYRSLLSS